MKEDEYKLEEARQKLNINWRILQKYKESRILQKTKNREYYEIQRVENITKYKELRILQNTKN